MSTNPDRLDILFKKYIAGSCTPQEMEEFWALLSQLTDEERLSIGLQEAWDNEKKTTPGSKEQWDRVYRRLHERILEEKKHTVHKWRRSRYLWPAAAALIGIMIAAGYFSYIKMFPKQQVHAKGVAMAAAKEVKAAVHVVTLPDGSVVTLRKDSKLQYDASFEKGAQRKVVLTGEAYFDVAHDEKRPFIVSTGKYNVRVLGTAFNVKMIANGLQVAVARGKVRVDEVASHKSMGVLLPGNQLTINNLLPAKDQAMAALVPANDVSVWTKQTFAFNNNTWEAVAAAISNQYGVNVKLKSAGLAACRFTADFTDKSLSECMDILCLLTHSKWYKDGESTVWVDGAGCN
ncbi:MAG: FecR domain-containing protein [Niabella sp.]|nr:FecR domain-containing protein [Niabella sp.]